MSGKTKPLFEPSPSVAVAESISDRLSQELVIGLVGPVASGVSTAGKYIAEILANTFGYAVADIIRMSDIIRTELPRVEKREPAKRPLCDYIAFMQDAGNALREKLGPNYLAEKAVEKIFQYREKNGGYDSSRKIVLPGRRAYLIDSIKNPEELQLLRQIYGETLCLIGVFAPDDVRRERLTNDGAHETDVSRILERDDREVMTFGQNTRAVFVEADFFICNDRKQDELRQQIERYLETIFDAGIHTPTASETAMYTAEASASNSACMSRQVGAAIVSSDGELISVGRNDVPKFGGGLYTEDDRTVWNEDTQSLEDHDNRCFKWKRRICHNDFRRNEILERIAKQVHESKLLKSNVKLDTVRQTIIGTGLESLTEFSRAIHAEMEAILAVAREGRHSLVGATLYTTTYPCHNCARHIVAAGIAKVIYVQPYKKSLATTLHGDAVSEDVNERHKVVFRQYEGVAPRNYLKLFRPTSPRKREGKYFHHAAKDAAPIFRTPLDAPSDYEAKVIADLADKEQDQL